MKTKQIIRRSSAADSAISSGSLLLKKVLAHRGIVNDDQLPRTLAQLAPPKLLKGLDESVAILTHHIQSHQRILIVGDFDCDGATSVALGILALKAMGARHVDYLVPNRFDYGYGLTPEIVDVAEGLAPDLIVTVDNGISSIAGVQHAKNKGFDVIVTDHHLPGDELPAADAILNPNQPGCAFPSKHLAGVGVIFYLMVGLRSHLREIGWFDRQGLADVNLASWLDIVALGTVADVVPLDKNNRLLVAQGIARINKGLCRPGIVALLQSAKKAPGHIRATDLGFSVGPRLNAAGRLDDISIGIRCLLTPSHDEATALANELNSFNIERREIEQGMQLEADEMVRKLTLDCDLPKGLCVYQADWHSGVVGIVASRLKERHHRPTLVFADEGEGQLKGSGRSIPGLHLRDALDLIAKRAPGLLTKFGGHAMAAGLTIKQTDFSIFNQLWLQVLDDILPDELLNESLLTDGELTKSEFSVDIANELEKAVPWGQGFVEPSFDGEFWLLSSRVLSGKHLKLSVAPKDAPQDAFDAVAFGVVDAFGHWPGMHAQKAKLVYRLNVNRWQGREKLQLMIDYIEPLFE